MSSNKTTDAKEEQSEDSDRPRNEAEVIASLECVLNEVNRQQDYRRHQIDMSVQLSRQLIEFASLASPLTALATAQVQWLKYVALILLAIAVALGLIDIFNPAHGEDELPLNKLRDDACAKSKYSVLLYQIDNKIENEAKARVDEDKRIRWIKRGYMFLGTAVLCTTFSVVNYGSIANCIYALVS